MLPLPSGGVERGRVGGAAVGRGDPDVVSAAADSRYGETATCVSDAHSGAGRGNPLAEIDGAIGHSLLGDLDRQRAAKPLREAVVEVRIGAQEGAPWPWWD